VTWKFPKRSEGVPVEVVQSEGNGWWVVRVERGGEYRAHADELVQQVSERKDA
jgi:hypothetical protein